MQQNFLIIYLQLFLFTYNLQLDYGLGTYRTGNGAEPLSTYQQRLLEVYLPPEFQDSNTEPTLAGDVFRSQS